MNFLPTALRSDAKALQHKRCRACTKHDVEPLIHTNKCGENKKPRAHCGREHGAHQGHCSRHCEQHSLKWPFRCFRRHVHVPLLLRSCSHYTPRGIVSTTTQNSMPAGQPRLPIDKRKSWLRRLVPYRVRNDKHAERPLAKRRQLRQHECCSHDHLGVSRIPRNNPVRPC